MEAAASAEEDSSRKILTGTTGKGNPAVTVAPHHDNRQDTCVICLSAITGRAVAVPCNHLEFDFLCLISWLQEQPSCPLCKAAITSVQYDWRNPDDFKTYHVPPPETAAKASLAPSTSASEWQRGRSVRPWARGRGDRNFQAYRPAGPRSEDHALSRRRRVYAQQTFSLHVGANRVSHFRDFTPASFSTTPELQSRARIFIRRELQVFAFLQDTSRVEFLLEYIVGILKKLEIKGSSGAAEGLVAEFLGRENARLFLHELEAWLRSPYMKLEDWDRHVQYAIPSPPSGNKVSGSSS